MAATNELAFDFTHEVAEADICNRALHRLGAARIRDTLENTKQANACREVYAITRDELLRMNEWNFASREDLIPIDLEYPYEKHGYAYAFVADARVELGAAVAAGASALITGVPASVTLDDRLIGRMVDGVNVRNDSSILAVDSDARTISLDRTVSGAASAMSVLIPLLKVWRVNGNQNELYTSVGAFGEQRILANTFSRSETENGVSVEKLLMRYTRRVIDVSLFDVVFTDALVLRIASKICILMTGNYALKAAIDQEFSAIMSAAKVVDSQERTTEEPDDWWTERRIGGGPSTRRRS